MDSEFESGYIGYQKRWSESELRRRIAEGERLLADIIRADSNPKLEWIRALIEDDLRAKRELLNELRGADALGFTQPLLAVAEPPPD